MDDPDRSPEALSGRWRLAARLPAPACRLLARPAAMEPVLLVADGEGGWWAVPAACVQCGALMEPSGAAGAEPAAFVDCHACGARHTPDCAGAVSCLVSDDEIYVLAER